MNIPELGSLLRFEPNRAQEIQARWLRMIELATFGDLAADSPAVLPRLRKRLLDLGERWRALFNDRTWIPKPREQLKNALGACLALRDALSATETAARELRSGSDLAEFRQLLDTMIEAVRGPVRAREIAWAELLERVNADALDGQND